MTTSRSTASAGERGGDDSGDDHGAGSTSGRIERLEQLTRFGWLAKGFVFVVIGALALRIATTDWSTGRKVEANQQGALRSVADQTIGPVLLAALASGLAVFCVWNVAQAVVPRSTDGGLLGIVTRVGWFGLGAFYGALGYASIRLAFASADSEPGDPSSVGSGSSTQPAYLSARIMAATGGRLLVIVVALVVAAIGLYHLRKGVSGQFLDDIEIDDLTERQERWLGRFGLVGFVARAVVLVVAAWFLLKAAIQFDPSEAVGLDGALRELATLTYGRLVLAVVGSGLVVAGAYDIITFRRQRIR